MDLPLAGIVAAIVVMTGVVAYEGFVLIASTPEPARSHQSSAVLIPAPELSPTAGTHASSNAPTIVESSAVHNSSRIEPDAAVNAKDTIISEPGNRKLTDYSPPANYDGHVSRKMAEDSAIASLEKRQRADDKKAKRQLQSGSKSWKVETTAKASYFNLGGHVDKDEVVDSLASSYLRDALKKHKNYSTLPTQIKASIEAANINLAKIAGYRTLLGVDDKKMEAEQGIKFVNISSSRGLEIDRPSADQDAVPDIGSSPIDLVHSIEWIWISGA